MALRAGLLAPALCADRASSTGSARRSAPFWDEIPQGRPPQGASSTSPGQPRRRRLTTWGHGEPVGNRVFVVTVVTTGRLRTLMALLQAVTFLVVRFGVTFGVTTLGSRCQLVTLQALLRLSPSGFRMWAVSTDPYAIADLVGSAPSGRGAR